MHNLKMLTQELGIYIGLISHLKKAPQGRSFEEGYVPSSDDLRGSGSIKQLSNNVYAISRNQQEEDDTQRNTSTLTVLKCRYTGRTGKADYLLFDEVTGRMVKGNPPEVQAVFGASDFN
jgi:twinkle protein